MGAERKIIFPMHACGGGAGGGWGSVNGGWVHDLTKILFPVRFYG